MLQWGRARACAEMQRLHEIHSMSVSASMGPRLGERGIAVLAIARNNDTLQDQNVNVD